MKYEIGLLRANGSYLWQGKIMGLVKKKTNYFMFQQTGRNGKTTSFTLKMQTYRHILKSKNKITERM